MSNKPKSIDEFTILLQELYDSLKWINEQNDIEVIQDNLHLQLQELEEIKSCIIRDELDCNCVIKLKLQDKSIELENEDCMLHDAEDVKEVIRKELTKILIPILNNEHSIFCPQDEYCDCFTNRIAENVMLATYYYY